MDLRTKSDRREKEIRTVVAHEARGVNDRDAQPVH